MTSSLKKEWNGPPSFLCLDPLYAMTAVVLFLRTYHGVESIGSEDLLEINGYLLLFLFVFAFLLVVSVFGTEVLFLPTQKKKKKLQWLFITIQSMIIRSIANRWPEIKSFWPSILLIEIEWLKMTDVLFIDGPTNPGMNLGRLQNTFMVNVYPNRNPI